MRLFKKSKKESSCCKVQFEEVKKDDKTKSCCDGLTEELFINKKTNKDSESCCN